MEGSAPPKVLEYTPNATTEKWRTERFDVLAAQFQFSSPWEAAMKEFHGFCVGHTQTSAWLIARRLFGIQPLIPTGEVHPDDLRPQTREELCASLGCPPEQIKAELDFLTAGWKGHAAKMAPDPGLASAAPAAIPAAAPLTARGELALDDRLLERFGYSDRLFAISIYDPLGGEDKKGSDVPRSDRDNGIERAWFCAKLRTAEWQKMLDEPMASALARETLVNELFLHRLQDEMMPLSPSSSKFRELSKVQSGIESQYRDQLERLQQKFPEMAIAGKVSFRGVISDLNLAHRQYYGGHNDRRLWDKLFTAAEIELLLRTSVQLPSPRFRLGWTVATVEAINGLYDPDFRSMLKKGDLKKLDMGVKAGIEKARQELGEKQVDLEKGVMPDEGDVFPDYGPDIPKL